MKLTLLILTILTAVHASIAQASRNDMVSGRDTLKIYSTHHTLTTPPKIDGLGDDEAWAAVEWGGDDFRQLSPDKGKPATVQTQFKILYDEKNLYVLIRCFDPEPTKIARRMSRRDSFEGDMVEINIDSYYDKRTAFSFTASVSGVKGDEYVSNNGDVWDPGWDPIWYLATEIDTEGWIAEFRIPLSQLRFTNKEELVWGLQITRIFFRNQERSVWQYIPPDAGGWVHLFGELHGIKGVKPQKQLEIQPFIVGQTERYQAEAGNPFMKGSESSVNFGLDAKIGITSDITLDLTVNPDFGQVEADPSQVNLSAFELYFQERRPFFIEGNNILTFPVGVISNTNLFYSRRIGRPPQGDVSVDESGEDDVDEYVWRPKNTTILGAAKLTGKNKKGFSWGLLESITQKEYAEVDSLGYRRRVPIEPFTNYFVVRAQQDIQKGNTIIGGMFTSTNRKIDDRSLENLHRDAYSGGVDFVHHWKKRAWYVSGKASFSHVEGSAKAIQETQKSSERFFQRPDNHHKNYDSTRTSLKGSGGQFLIGKKSGNIIADLGVIWQSPEFDLNDVGFMAQTDQINQWFWAQYRVQQPRGITRSQRYNINQWRDYDFGKRLLGSGYNTNAHFTFKNFWATGMGVTLSRDNVSNADLRGGPSIRYPGGYYLWSYIRSDNRKKLWSEVYYELFRGNHNYSRQDNMSVDLVFQPVNALNIAISSSFTKNVNHLQWVGLSEENGTSRYIVGELRQTVARISARITYMITPNLSIQYWGQPFGTAGRYRNYKVVTNPRAATYTNRFSVLQNHLLTLTEDSYDVDEDSNGLRDFSFDRPDFNFGQFRSNMVIRWEYIPGSTLFLVWTRERNGEFYDHQAGKRSYSFDFDEKAYNIFLIKYTYRLVL